MPSQIELGVAEMFRDATQNAVALEMRTGADWDRFNAIKEDAHQRSETVIQSFERERPERLAAARKDIIDKAGSLNLEHPTPFGTDKFDKSAIDRQAHRRVENDHQNKLLAISQNESDAYVALREDIHAREGIRSHARDAFTRSTDRREGTDRRMPSQDR